MHHEMGNLRLGGMAIRYSLFVPFAQLLDGRRFVFEQQALFDTLIAMPFDNADRLDFNAAIATMAAAEAVELSAL